MLAERTALEQAKQICQTQQGFTVSKNVSNGVAKVRVQVVPALACLANEIGYF